MEPAKPRQQVMVKRHFAGAQPDGSGIQRLETAQFAFRRKNLLAGLGNVLVEDVSLRRQEKPLFCSDKQRASQIIFQVLD